MSPYGESACKTYGGLKGVKIWILHHRGLMQSERGRANPVFRMNLCRVSIRPQDKQTIRCATVRCTDNQLHG